MNDQLTWMDAEDYLSGKFRPDRIPLVEADINQKNSLIREYIILKLQEKQLARIRSGQKDSADPGYKKRADMPLTDKIAEMRTALGPLSIIDTLRIRRPRGESTGWELN